MVYFNYQFIQKAFRQKINLKKEPYNSSIIFSVKKVAPQVNVAIRKDHFTLYSNNKKNIKPRLIGRSIASNCPELKALVKEYHYEHSDGKPGRSGQLFRRF